MTDGAAELIKLRSLCPAAELWDEGGQPLVFLPGLKVESGGAFHVVDGLLCPRARDGYPTRMFFSRSFAGNGMGQNWNVFNIKSRPWHACSWKDVPAALPWLEIVANHLRPLR